MAQVNDEISRQIFDDLDKQLDAQMMAELEKCQEEQSRRMDEELDRQVTEMEGCQMVALDHHQLESTWFASVEGANISSGSAGRLILIPQEALIAFNFCRFAP